MRIYSLLDDRNRSEREKSKKTICERVYLEVFIPLK